MPEDLKSLLDRIQKDGVEKAEAEAGRIVAAAREKAAGVVREAQAAAEAARQKAEQDAAAFRERAEKSLQQAARDVVLSVGQAIDKTFASLVRRRVAETLDAPTLASLLADVVKAYCAKEGNRARIDILLPPDKQKQVLDLFLAEFGGQLREGIEIRADEGVVSGFRVALVNDQLEHDFSGQAIADALCQLIRPHIGKIVQDALAK